MLSVFIEEEVRELELIEDEYRDAELIAFVTFRELLPNAPVKLDEFNVDDKF
jgi:hypothetical protein